MSGTSISFFYALVYAVWGSGVPGRWVWKGDDFPVAWANVQLKFVDEKVIY